MLMDEPLLTGRLRLVFWQDADNAANATGSRWQDDAWNVANQLVESLSPLASVEIDGNSVKEDRNEKEEHTFAVTIRVSHRRLPTIFARFTAAAMRLLSEECDRVSLRFAITVASREFYDPQFRFSDVLPVAAAYFGNVKDKTTFLNHRRVEPNGRMETLQQYFPDLQLTSLMAADFAHDQRELRVVFPSAEHDEESGWKISISTLRIEYRTIRQILVNASVNENRTMRFLLFLNISCPPIINRVFVNDSDTADDLRTCRKSRYVSWDFRRRDTVSKDDADYFMRNEICDSPYLRIDLDNIETVQYGSILDRLSQLAEVKPEVRSLAFENLPFRFSRRCNLNSEDFRHRLGLDDKFPLAYMVAALMSRGAVFNDYFLYPYKDKPQAHCSFIRMLVAHYESEKDRTLTALEMLLHYLDDQVEPGDPWKAFGRYWNKLGNAPHEINTYDEVDDDGYIRIRKVVITPTRTLFMAPELIMSNQALRTEGGPPPVDFLRIVFRDEDYSKVFPNKVTPTLVDIFVRNKLEGGVTIGGRVFHFLGASSSQLRDTGCYFLNASPEECMRLVRNSGRYDMESIPKMMSRVGQLFTQSQEVNLSLNRVYYANSYDYAGGRNFKNEPYTFSDGVGCLSMRTAQLISEGLDLRDSCVPSCFQFRYRGYKGVLSVNPVLDQRRVWGEQNGKDLADTESNDERWVALSFIFRPSQQKFSGVPSESIGVVKYSSPSSVALNQRLINILDQISSLQSRVVHRRIVGRIHSLLSSHLQRLTKSLVNECAARNTLSEFPKPIQYEKITSVQMTREPFFRSLLLESARATLKKLRARMQISVPPDLGQCMFGVVDESGELQYGQVFLRYTANVRHRRPSEKHQHIIHSGPVMVTKNPMTVGGDVRMLQAVDIPSLRHLSDVIVFPRYGPRPHSDQTAGSDLDGDEYTVIWDAQLLLDRNEPAFDYTPREPRPDPKSEEKLRDEMIEFYVEYVKQDSVGQIGNAFLINSDLYGIKTEVCKRTAEKHMLALDFSKTGLAPEPLAYRWDHDVPPERWVRAPDFMEKNANPSYISRRLNGQLYRRIKRIDDLMTEASGETNSSLTPVDYFFVLRTKDRRPKPIPKVYLEKAESRYNEYTSGIQNIMDTFGVNTEGELFSGSFVSLRARLCENKNNFTSKYTTDEVIVQQLSQLFYGFRLQYLTSFDDNLDAIAPVDKRYEGSGTNETFRRICTRPTAQLRMLAAAYYRIAYDAIERRHLSFAWLAWYVLDEICKYNQVNYPDTSVRFRFDPFSDDLSKHISVFLEDPEISSQFRWFKDQVEYESRNEGVESPGWKVVKHYCMRHDGLDQLMFYVVAWGRMRPILVEWGGAGLSELHLCLLVIQFGLGLFPTDSVEPAAAWLEETDDEPSVFGDLNLSNQTGGLGRKLMAFLEYVASRHCQHLAYIDFAKPHKECRYTLQNGECQSLHKLAQDTYYRIAFTGSFARLPCTSDQREELSMYQSDPPEMEAEPFVIEVPPDGFDKMVQHEEMLVRSLKEKTGCTHIVYCKLPTRKDKKTTSVIISAKGTIASVNALRAMLLVEAPTVPFRTEDTATTSMANQHYEKLMEVMPQLQIH